MTTDETTNPEIDSLNAALSHKAKVIEQQASIIEGQNQVIKRLQREVAELPALREYLKDLIPIHRSCGQLVDCVVSLVPDANDPRHKQARAVEKRLKTHGQR